MNEPTLDQLALQEQVPALWTDKSSRLHDYLRIYEEQWWPMRHAPIRILEIGLNVGASIKLWLDYFSEAQVCGVDIADFKTQVGILDPYRFKFCQGDASDPAFWDRFKSENPPFDIIIDDGCHASGPIIVSHRCLWPHVKPGGWYVIEDLGEERNNPASRTEGFATQSEYCLNLLGSLILMVDGDVDRAVVYRELVMLQKKYDH